jgi:hypothetical protein
MSVGLPESGQFLAFEIGPGYTLSGHLKGRYELLICSSKFGSRNYVPAYNLTDSV